MENEKLGRAIRLLQKEFGDEWQMIAQSLGIQDLCSRCGKELTSFIAYPERGEGGSNKWRGNCSPKVVEAILKYILETKKYYRKDTSTFTLLDPMSGSGTSKAVADKYHVNSILYDLNPAPAYGKGGWDALTNDVEDSADLIFFHPPYHDIIRYSGNMWGRPNSHDLSRCVNYNDFIEKLNFIIKKLYLALRKDGRLAVLVGDIRSKGEFHSIQSDMMKIDSPESFIVKGQYNCVADSRRYSSTLTRILKERQQHWRYVLSDAETKGTPQVNFQLESCGVCRTKERMNKMTNEYKSLTEFYPTPPELAAKMLEGIDFEEFDSVLEPSAGKGDLIGFYLRAKRDIHFSCRYSKEEMICSTDERKRL